MARIHVTPPDPMEAIREMELVYEARQPLNRAG